MKLPLTVDKTEVTERSGIVRDSDGAIIALVPRYSDATILVNAVNKTNNEH